MLFLACMIWGITQQLSLIRLMYLIKIGMVVLQAKMFLESGVTVRLSAVYQFMMITICKEIYVNNRSKKFGIAKHFAHGINHTINTRNYKEIAKTANINLHVVPVAAVLQLVKLVANFL